MGKYTKIIRSNLENH